MKIRDIITEDADGSGDGGAAMSTSYSDIATVNFPLFGKKKMIRRAVDPNGYLPKKKKKASVGYVNPVKG